MPYCLRVSSGSLDSTVTDTSSLASWDGLLDGFQNGVVPRVGKAVVAAHDHVVFPAAHLLVNGQAVLGHPLDRVALLDHGAAVFAKAAALPIRQGQPGNHVGEQAVCVRDGVGAAAEVGIHRLFQQLRDKQSGVPLGAGEHHGPAGGMASSAERDTPTKRSQAATRRLMSVRGPVSTRQSRPISRLTA